MNLGNSVWDRAGYEHDSISRNQFLLLMGFFTVLGLAITAVGAYFTTGWLEVIPAVTPDGDSTYLWHGPVNFWLFWVGVLVSGIAGVLIALNSDKPAISALGYLMVAGPFGLLLGPTVGMYESASVVKVLFITGGIVSVMALIGAVIPESLERWWGWLFAGLLFLILGQFGLPLAAWLIPGFPVEGALTLFDWIGVLLFSAYVIYDMNRAMRVPATVDNAIDCALALYLDIINLFLYLLRALGNKR